MKKALMFLALFILPFLSFSQYGEAGYFYDGSSFLAPNSDFTQVVDTGNYKIWDSTASNNTWYNKSGFYGRKENDSLYYGFTMSNIEWGSITVFNHHKASVCGKGADSSSNYGVVHGTDYGADIDFYIGVRGNMPAMLFSFYVTNAAIAAQSMMYGDSTARKFGGMDGTDPDWLKLTIFQYQYGGLIDSIEVYLADFRSPDSTEDFILKDWKRIDLNSSNRIDSLSFKLTSSDTDSLGNMNTPDYFCIDNLYIEHGGGIENVKNKIKATIFPNPAKDFMNIKTEIPVNASIYTINGKLLLQRQNCRSIDMSGFSPGAYLLKIQDRKSEAASNYTILKE